METHKPKPWHGWREFLKEYAIIVAGVLTALSAEQAAEWLHWGARTEQGRARLVAEVQHQFVVDEEYLAVQPCLEQQLNRIEQAVLSSAATLSPLPIHSDSNVSFVYRAPSRSWTESAWQSVIAEGLVSHFSQTERRLLPVHYSQMGRMRSLADEEAGAVGQLLALSKPLPMDGQVKATYVGVIEQERYRSQGMAVIARDMNRDIARLGYLPDTAARQAWLRRSGTLQFCESVQSAATQAKVP